MEIFPDRRNYIRSEYWSIDDRRLVIVGVEGGQSVNKHGKFASDQEMIRKLQRDNQQRLSSDCR